MWELCRACRMCQGTRLSLCREAPTNCLLCISFWESSLCSTGNIPSHLQEQDHTCLFYYKFKKANRSQSASKATVHTSDYKEINSGRSFYIEDWKGAAEYHSSLFMTFANRPIATSNQEQTKTTRGEKHVFVGPPGQSTLANFLKALRFY